jgi:hypothetical protein
MGNGISIFRGDSTSIQCTVCDSAGDIFNLTGTSEITFTVKEREDDTVALFTKTLGAGEISISSPETLGFFIVTIASADTKLLSGIKIYDCQVEIAGKKYTVVKDNINIKKDVTI